ncbi:MAG: hypothetical protein Tsb0020_24100 [Haliangiales bacterium]
MPRCLLRIALAALALTIGPALTSPPLPAPRVAYADRGLVHGLPLPPRTRSSERDLFTSGRGFRATVDFYTRHLNRRGLRHQAIPIYRYRGVTVARFLSQSPGTEWSALHVFQEDSRTSIFILPRPARSLPVSPPDENTAHQPASDP